LALAQGDVSAVKKCDMELEAIGGREEYQKASQLSTSFHSTSKWVIGTLAKMGWLYGIQLEVNEEPKDASKAENKKHKRSRRPTRLLEVGAINTELLDAAQEEVLAKDDNSTKMIRKFKYKLSVRAIDINSMEKRIEEQDFLTMPFSSDDPTERYDVIVCSMVLNCIATPLDRGKMLAKLYHHLRPGGRLFLTIPKFCLTKSAFLTPEIFQKMLGPGGVGFDVDETKETPRISFFICTRPIEETRTSFNTKWTKETIRNKGKKFPNQFSVVLDEKQIIGRKSG
jgi:25S rRNA (adenine2142-N1)-methyltransferase